MATMYSLFLSLLFTAVCSVNGCRNSVLDVFKSSVENGFYTLYQGRDFHFFLDEKTKQKTGTKWSSAKLNQGLVARLNCSLISGNKTNSPEKSGSNKSDCASEIINNSLRLAQPRPSYSVSASSSLRLLNLSPTKFLTIVGGCTSFVSKVLSDEFFASFFAENDEVLIHSFESKKSLDKKEEPCHGLSGVEAKHSGMEDNNKNKKSRQSIIVIASKELGTREATDNNDGPRIEEYLRYTNLGPHHEWCAAFISWCYGQGGFDVPRNPWSPALFPKARQISKDQCRSADVFGIYGSAVKRINHVGLIKKKQGEYLITIEGNSNNRVESRRRHLKTVYALANWVNE